MVLTDSLKGNTPAERWKHFEDSCFAISLPPSRAEWLAALYEYKEHRVSRKTGITIDGLHYKSDEIETLINKYGEQRPLRVLFNPDDFRHVHVYEGDDFPLVTLPHEHLRPETPAWSFTEAKERFKKQKASVKPTPQAEKFDKDLHEQVVADSLAPKRRKPSKHERNRETARREKEQQAVVRASRNPSPRAPSQTCRPTKASEEAPIVAQPNSSIFDGAALLPVLDRANGIEI
ncbi:Mu transposase C-terminal domain-containing protein [Cupriavidus campinensis]|uniref:Mu transposase C-terminal domain-containing protein n=1 Tax=Cupriavidus campinensis TaxID=151783 RepID=A0AAE9I106_9BURK|nr:Mu transposase C-terminal domain-containing protein [Cupriavidus campinensis]URF04306.1 Mu transposase C-terminal domain-containing protein [Cupriavidus campinensis]